MIGWSPVFTRIYPSITVHEDIQNVLLSEEQITVGIDRVAAEITKAFRGEKFTVVSILKGSCIFASDLIRRIPVPLELAFVSASSYGEGTTSGELAMNFFPTDQEIRGRRLLLVDDILDTGKTMSSLVNAFKARGAAEVRSCVFLDKPSRRSVEYRADFRCFEVENLFVVGYGLDYAGLYRNLPYVGVLRPEIFEDEAENPKAKDDATV
ncbi:MAG: hypoxanthine phosphoribosyltransferase [Planctomycetota bacterium]